MKIMHMYNSVKVLVILSFIILSCCNTNSSHENKSDNFDKDSNLAEQKVSPPKHNSNKEGLTQTNHLDSIEPFFLDFKYGMSPQEFKSCSKYLDSIGRLNYRGSDQISLFPLTIKVKLNSLVLDEDPAPSWTKWEKVRELKFEVNPLFDDNVLQGVSLKYKRSFNDTYYGGEKYKKQHRNKFDENCRAFSDAITNILYSKYGNPIAKDVVILGTIWQNANNDYVMFEDLIFAGVFVMEINYWSKAYFDEYQQNMNLEKSNENQRLLESQDAL